jgi:NTE family protein
MNLWRRARPAGSTAFVLSGGGTFGATQVGMLRALVESGISADLVVGVSVGALNGAGYAACPDRSGVDELAQLWQGLTAEQIYPRDRLHGPWRYFQSRPSVYSPEGLRSVISQFLPYRDLADAAVPVHVVAAALPGVTERWFDRGPAVDVLAASAALPGLYPPVVLDGEQLIDGGVVDNVPIRRAVELGARRIFVLLAAPHERTWPDRPFRMILEAFSVAHRARFLRDLADVPAGVEVTVIAPEKVPAADFRDFDHTEELLAAGHEAAAAALASGSAVSVRAALALAG